MRRLSWVPHAATAAPADVDWTVTVIEPLPDCSSVEAGWERIATQTRWGEWRSESKMRGKDVATTVVPPATEPLKTGDEYIAKVGRFMEIHCRVLESSSAGIAAGEDDEMVFDAMGVALGGIVRARFRFTVFRAKMAWSWPARRRGSSPCLSSRHPRKPLRVSTGAPSRTSTRASCYRRGNRPGPPTAR